MDILSLSVLLGLIVVSDQILNGQYKFSRRLLDWIDRRSEGFSRQSQSGSKSQGSTD